MMEKINVAELLLHCPKGMELDCIMLEGSVVFEDISDDEEYPIGINLKNGDYTNLTKYGQYLNLEEAKCVIFPKGKTTWEGFVPPCKFKEGDILTTDIGSIFIFSHLELDSISDRNICKAYVGIQNTMPISLFHTKQSDIFGPYESKCKLATEKEKQKLFQAIKDNGYKWNPETKTLEKLPKFKVGDRIRHKCPEFRGERIITNCNDTGYFTTINDWIDIEHQDDWELVPNKFDINTLKPFDKVLVRNHEKNEWQPNFFNKYCKEINSFKLIGICTPSYANNQHFVNYCIPYEGNEHLLGKTDDCNNYFKTWE